MAVTKYCWCYSLDVGVTLIGFLHLNAALFFWARAFTFEPIYMWVDILIAACYTVRTTYFFLMLSLGASTSSRVDYFNMNKYTAYGLGGCGTAVILLKWLEWSHPPTWTLVAWVLVGLFNYYHWVVLQEYAGLTNGGSRIELVAQEEPADATTGFETNKME